MGCDQAAVRKHRWLKHSWVSGGRSVGVALRASDRQGASPSPMPAPPATTSRPDRYSRVDTRHGKAARAGLRDQRASPRESSARPASCASTHCSGCSQPSPEPTSDGYHGACRDTRHRMDRTQRRCAPTMRRRRATSTTPTPSSSMAPRVSGSVWAAPVFASAATEL